MFSDNRNDKFYDCLVKSYVWEENTNILILSCQYLDRGATKIALREVWQGAWNSYREYL